MVFGVSHGEAARAPSAAGAPRAGAACGWQQRSAAGLGIPSAGRELGHHPETRWETERKRELLNHDFVFNLTVS